MSYWLGRIVRNFAGRVAFDPETRDKAVKTGRGFVDEAKSISRDDDPARAAGRSFKRALNRFQAAASDDTDKDTDKDSEDDGNGRAASPGTAGTAGDEGATSGSANSDDAGGGSRNSGPAGGSRARDADR